MKKMKVMFVCLGNICRSPLAHAVFEDLVEKEGLPVETESCGMGSWHVGEPSDGRMRRTAAGHGVNISHYARAFRPSDLDEYDLVIPMDRQNLKDLKRYARSEHMDKIHLMREWDLEGGVEVPDPYYGGDQGFENVYDIVERSCRSLIADLKQRM